MTTEPTPKTLADFTTASSPDQEIFPTPPGETEWRCSGCGELVPTSELEEHNKSKCAGLSGETPEPDAKPSPRDRLASALRLRFEEQKEENVRLSRELDLACWCASQISLLIGGMKRLTPKWPADMDALEDAIKIQGAVIARCGGGKRWPEQRVRSTTRAEVMRRVDEFCDADLSEPDAKPSAEALLAIEKLRDFEDRNSRPELPLYDDERGLIIDSCFAALRAEVEELGTQNRLLRRDIDLWITASIETIEQLDNEAVIDCDGPLTGLENLRMMCERQDEEDTYDDMDRGLIQREKIVMASRNALRAEVEELRKALISCVRQMKFERECADGPTSSSFGAAEANARAVLAKHDEESTESEGG